MSNPSGKLFIGGLSFDTTDETFKEYFQQFGDVTDARNSSGEVPYFANNVEAPSNV